MTHNNKLPPHYKSHFALLNSQWDLIQSLKLSECIKLQWRIITEEKMDEYETYYIEIDWLKARAMEELMPFLPSKEGAIEIYLETRMFLLTKNENSINHPMDILANGLVSML